MGGTKHTQDLRLSRLCGAIPVDTRACSTTLTALTTHSATYCDTLACWSPMAGSTPAAGPYRAAEAAIPTCSEQAVLSRCWALQACELAL